MANVFYVMVYESSFDLSKIEPRTICTNPPCGNVAFTNAGYQRVEVIKQSDYKTAKSTADKFASSHGILKFTLISIDLG